MSETLPDAIARLGEMVTDHGQTWDLSPNDEHAISLVLAEIAALRAELQRLRLVIVNAPHDPYCETGGCNCWKARAI